MRSNMASPSVGSPITSQPSCNRELAGDENGTAAMTVLDNLHEIAPLTDGEAVRPPIVEHNQINLDEPAE